MSYITHDDEENTDLLLGDLGLSSRLDVDAYINLAFDEMTVALGRCYTTPLPAEVDLDVDDLKHLKYIQQTLATGYLYLAQAGASGNEHLNAYGEKMLELGHARIRELCELGTFALTSVAVKPLTGQGPGGADLTGSAPVVVQYDNESGVEAYMAFTHRSLLNPWDWGGGSHGYGT